MTKEELMALLRDPDQTGQSVNELNHLIDEYSYFHTGHQLYLQGLKKTDAVQLAKQLNQSAMNVRDRGLLYNYINRPNTFRRQTSIPQDEVEEVVQPFAPGNAFVSPETDIAHIQHEEDIRQMEAEQIATSSSLGGFEGVRQHSGEYTLAEEKIMSNEELMAIIQQQLEEINPAVAQLEQEKTPEIPLVSATADAPVVEKENDAQASVLSTETLTSELQRNTMQEEQADIIRKPVDVAESVNPENPPEQEKTGKTTLSMESFISELQKQKNENEEAGKPENEEISEYVTENDDQPTLDLIDSFIRTNPKIVPTNTDYQVDLTESLHEDMDIVTETLADIYISQGHIQKAMDIYEHLILKYPEKHIYFAAQIDRLKQRIK